MTLDVNYAVSYEAAAQRYAPFLSAVSQVRVRMPATAGEMLSAGIGVSDIEPARKIASHDLLKRRRLTNIAFNIAVSQRVEGNEPGCRTWMMECAGLQNPLIEYEWHLAKAEFAG